MPIARFQMPDGRIARFEVPDGTTPEQAQSLISESMTEAPKAPSEPIKMGADAFPDTLRQVLQDTDWGTRNIAAAGTALSDLWQGAKQFVGKGDKQAIDANKIIADEAPVGALAGNAALAAVPFSLAGNSLKAAGAVGAGLGALAPVQGDQSIGNVAKGKAVNTALGGGLAVGGQAVANKAGSLIADKMNALQAAKTQRAPIDATIKEALDAGYVIPPGQINPSFINRQLESMGGKIATQQMASSRNQEVTDRLARSAAGLAPDMPITPAGLKSVRTQLGKAYDDVGAVVGNDTVETLKTLRADANDLWAMQARNPHPETLAKARQATSDAQALEQSIDGILKSAGKDDVLKAFKDARKKIAISHTVENALIEGGGTIDARAIAREAQKGKPLSGELATIGNFANNFPKVTQPDKMVGSPDAHNLKFIASLLLGGGGGAALGPAGIAAGALPIAAGPLARSIMFSKPVQQGLLSDYSLGLLPRVGGGLLQNAPVAGTVGGLYALGQ